MTLRLRLVLGLVVLVTAGLAVFGFATYELYSRSQYDRLDDQIRASASTVVGSLAHNAGLASDEGGGPGHGFGGGGPGHDGGPEGGGPAGGRGDRPCSPSWPRGRGSWSAGGCARWSRWPPRPAPSRPGTSRSGSPPARAAPRSASSDWPSTPCSASSNRLSPNATAPSTGCASSWPTPPTSSARRSPRSRASPSSSGWAAGASPPPASTCRSSCAASRRSRPA